MELGESTRASRFGAPDGARSRADPIAARPLGIRNVSALWATTQALPNPWRGAHHHPSAGLRHAVGGRHSCPRRTIPRVGWRGTSRLSPPSFASSEQGPFDDCFQTPTRPGKHAVSAGFIVTEELAGLSLLNYADRTGRRTPCRRREQWRRQICH